MDSDTATTGAPTATSSTALGRALGAGTHLVALPTWIVGPLIIIWLSRDDTVKEHARHAVNWQLTVGVVAYLAGALVVATVLTGNSLFVLWSSVLAVIVLGGNLLFCGVAAVRAARGEHWEYPVAIRVLESGSISRTF